MSSKLLDFSKAVIFAAMILLAGSTVHAQVAGLAERNMSKLTEEQNECAIIKNPGNKLQLFAFCNNHLAGMFAARSVDGGVTWVYPDPSKTIANGTNPALGPAACCDPSLAWDTFGNLFITYIDSTLSNVVTLLSQDGGQTFSTLASFASCAGCPDQPTVTAASTSAPGAPVAVWIVWHQNAPTGPIVATGAAVTGLGTVGAFSALLNVPGTADCSYGDVAISPAGVVVQVCENPSTGDAPPPAVKNIFVNTKPDGLGPNAFNAAVTATTTNVGAFHFIPVQDTRSIDAEPGLAYDRNPSSPHFGRLYLVYTEETPFGSNNTDIMLRFSDNDGGAWSSPPIRVNDDATAKSQFLPRIATNSLSGDIAVCWHDARNSPGNNTMQEFCTIATPTGASPTFMANAQISAGTSNPNGSNPPTGGSDIQFGDYSGLTYFQGLAHPAWADDSNSTGDNPDGTARYDAYTNRVTGGAAAHEGDPHLTTVNSVHYDFQGAGEFTVLRDYDGLEIQTRQEPIATTFFPAPDAHDGLATCVSLNTAVAARVGQHRVTYEPNLSGVPDPSGLQLRVDGNLTTLGTSGLDLGDGGRVVKLWTPGGIEIDFPNETALYAIPNWWISQSKWYLNVDVSHTPALEGTLGVIPANSWLPALPNGASMGPMPGALHDRYVSLYRAFADAWRVTNKTSLFDYAPGSSTDTFTMRSWPLEKPPCVLPKVRPVPPATQAVAERACSEIKGNRHSDCIFDVLVSGNTGFADTYLQSQRIELGSTSTVLADDANPSLAGEWVTFTAIVTPNAIDSKRFPAGHVQFFLDGSKVEEPVKLDSMGRATWETSRLKVGTHQVVASYSPSDDSLFLPSSSLDDLHTVRRCFCEHAAGAK